METNTVLQLTLDRRNCKKRPALSHRTFWYFYQFTPQKPQTEQRILFCSFSHINNIALKSYFLRLFFFFFFDRVHPNEVSIYPTQFLSQSLSNSRQSLWGHQTDSIFSYLYFMFRLISVSCVGPTLTILTQPPFSFLNVTKWAAFINGRPVNMAVFHTGTFRDEHFGLIHRPHKRKNDTHIASCFWSYCSSQPLNANEDDNMINK